MSSQNEALQKALNEMQIKAMAVSQELQVVKQQEAALARRIKLSEATENQLKEITGSKSSNDSVPTVWKGVGKMFISTSLDDQVTEMSKERNEYKDQISALGKKKYYLETTYTNVVAALGNATAKP